MRKGRYAYPIIIEDTGEGFYVDIPDFDIGTQGTSIADAIEMARDAIGLAGIEMLDRGLELPKEGKTVHSKKGQIVTLVDIDFEDYKSKIENRSVKKNCTIPYWMSVEADKAGVNYSKILQESLAKILKLRQNKA